MAENLMVGSCECGFWKRRALDLRDLELGESGRNNTGLPLTCEALSAFRLGMAIVERGLARVIGRRRSREARSPRFERGAVRVYE